MHQNLSDVAAAEVRTSGAPEAKPVSIGRVATVLLSAKDVLMAYVMPINTLGTLLGSTPGVRHGSYLYTSRESGTLNPGRYMQPMVLAGARGRPFHALRGKDEPQ